LQDVPTPTWLALFFMHFLASDRAGLGNWGLSSPFSYQISAISSSEPICIRLEGSFLQMTMAFQIRL